MKTIRYGECSPEVMFLQCLLNKYGTRPILKEDGCYGLMTKTAVEFFKRNGGLSSQNGKYVDDITWSKFGKIFYKSYWIGLYGQPTGKTCWSAAATMVKGSMSIGSGSAVATPGLESSLENVEVFVKELGLNFIAKESMPPPIAFYRGLQHGPIWCVFSGSDFKHAVAISGLWSDGDASGNATVMRVHDPWPVKLGTIYSSTYRGRMLTIRAVKGNPKAMINYAAV